MDFIEYNCWNCNVYEKWQFAPSGGMGQFLGLCEKCWPLQYTDEQVANKTRTLYPIVFKGQFADNVKFIKGE